MSRLAALAAVLIAAAGPCSPPPCPRGDTIYESFDTTRDGTVVVMFDVVWESRTENNAAYRLLGLDVRPARAREPKTYVADDAGEYVAARWPTFEDASTVPAGTTVVEHYKAELPAASGEALQITVSADFACNDVGPTDKDLAAEITNLNVTEG